MTRTGCAGLPGGSQGDLQVSSLDILVGGRARLSVGAEELSFGHTESEEHENGDSEQGGEMQELQINIWGPRAYGWPLKLQGRDETTQSKKFEVSGVM